VVIQSLKNVYQNLQKAPPAQVQDVPASEPKDWTVLVYMEGRHRLAHSTDLALNKLEKVGTTDKVNLVVQATQDPTWQELTLPNMQSLPTRRYVISKDDDAGKVTSPVVQEFPEQLKLTEETLADFVKWGMEKFPARHTMLVIKKQGAGFARISQGDDDFAPLSARELSSALQKAGKKLDVVAFDSSSMQQLEVAYQLRHGAEVMAGSQEDTKAAAYPYDALAERLNARAGQATAREVGKMVVDVHRGQSSIHGAADLSRLGRLQETMKGFVEAVKAEKVAPELLYTSMASVIPMERKSLGLSFDFRDLGTLLTDVNANESYPQSVRDAAQEARISLDQSSVAQYASAARQELKSPTGLSTWMPWKGPSDKLHETYGQLDWARDSGWADLIDYVHAERPKLSVPESLAPPQEKTLGLAQSIGKWGLYQYKKYISPYLEARCAYTPSCSQYARQAIETHGLTEGMKMGFLRLVSCDGHNRGADPVPGHTCSADCGCGTPQIREDLLIAPPPRADKSELRQRAEGFATQAAATAGSVLGGLGLGLLSAPIGAAVGAYFGYKAGTDTIDGLTAEMLPKYGEAKVRAYLKLARPVGMPAYNLNKKIEAWTGSTTLAKVVGGVAGGISGAVLGLGGGALQGYNWGSAFGRLWALNRTREAFGEMPTDPRTAAILKRDYEN